MEHNEYAKKAAEWWVNSLRVNEDAPKDLPKSFEDIVMRARLIRVLSEKIRRAVENWNGGAFAPFSIDTTGVCDPLLEEALNEVGIDNYHFQENVFMEISKMHVVANIRAKIF